MIEKEMYATHGQKKTSNQRYKKEKDNRTVLLNNKKILTQIINEEQDKI
jgi:hypothetical protein